MTQHEHNQLDEVNTKIDRILFYLLDDPETDSKGLVSQTKELTDKVSKIETDEKVKRGKVAAITVVGSGLLTAIIWVIENTL